MELYIKMLGGNLADNQEEEMGKVFVNVGLSLDGYLAPEEITLENRDNPDYKNWAAKWAAMMAGIFNRQYFRYNLMLGPAGETRPVNEMLKETTERIAEGADVIQQYPNAGIVDELEIAIAPVLFGSGRRLFEKISDTPGLRIDRVLDTPLATYLRYVRA